MPNFQVGRPYSTAPVVVTRSLVLESNHSWMLHIHGHRVDPSHIPSFDDKLHLDSASTIASLLQIVCSLNTCVGNPDTKIIELAKCKKNDQFLTLKHDVVAYLDAGTCVSIEGQKSALPTAIF